MTAALATAVMYCANDNRRSIWTAMRDDFAPGATYRPQLARGDGHMHFQITRSIVFDRDFNFDNDLALYGDPWNQPRTVTGRKNVMQQIGPSLVWAPLLVVAHGVALVGNVFGADIPTHGYTMFHQRILYASSVGFAWLAVGLGILVVMRLVGGRWAATWAAIAVLLGTSLTYYATFMPSYAHAMDAAACAGFLALWALTLGDLRWRRYVWLGVLLGIATMVRIQDVGFGVVLALELGVLAWQRLRAGARVSSIIALLGRGALVLAITGVMFVPQLYVWKITYGSWLTTPQGPGQMRYGHPMVLELLFSSRNGWLSTHPIAYLGTIGLVVGMISGPRLGKHVRLVSGALLASIAFQVYVNAVTYEWWSAASFGQRRMCSVTLPLVVGLAILVRWTGLRIGARIPFIAKQAIAIGGLGYLVAWNLAWVGQLTSARSAGRDNLATCCSDVPAPLSWIARPVYAVIGNPFEFPANAWFAVRHGVELQRWDTAVGNYALVPGVLGYNDGSYRKATATWNALDERYLLGGWSAQQREAGRSFRWTVSDTASLLVPLLMPEPHRMTMPIRANAAPGERLYVQIACNDRVVAETFVGAEWTTVAFETDGRIGENEVTIVANVRPARMASGPKVPVGVAIGPVRVSLP
ncbi:MAG: hypothetical protein H6Q90_3183 [Deltaproteobacteria bacterium]|nr:hypothetical protein [Deltaproteobacteria bacterium]